MPPAAGRSGDRPPGVDRRVAGRAARRRAARWRRAGWAAELAIVGVALGWALRRPGAAGAASASSERLGRLSEANELLSSLHQLAQALPSSLDLEQSLDSTVRSLRSFWDLHALAILVPDETSTRWMVARQEGVRLPLLLDPDDLPPVVARALHLPPGGTAVVSTAGDGGGLTAASGSGLYAPLHARGQLVGLVAVEHAGEGYFGARDVTLLEGLTATVALSVDNARWFARLRTVGADAERTRIARELHDRVGQSLASLGFELDRLSRHSADHELRPGIDRLRRDLRGAMAEIRDTLYDLRTDVSDERGLVPTLESFLDRVGRRTGIAVRLEAGADEDRLPLLQEREMWLIAQEAVTNAERHGHPEEIVVRWCSDGHRATLEVADDGCGFSTGGQGMAAAHGIRAMRERAASIGAHLSVDSAPGDGTRVRCALEAS